MHPFEVLADPVRRAVLTLLAHRPHTAGELVDAVGGAFDISQPAVSRQLGILRNEGYVHSSADGSKRIYSLASDAFAEAERALAQLRGGARVGQALDALHTEVARGKRGRVASSTVTTPTPTPIEEAS